MPYATLQELTDRYGAALLVALTDRGEVATGMVDSAVVTKALADASEVIDGFLAVKYVIPLVTVPGLVNDLCKSIAIYKLHITMPEEKIARDYQDAMKSLRDISDGRLRIPAEGVEPASTGSTGAILTDRDRDFSAVTMKGFI